MELNFSHLSMKCSSFSASFMHNRHLESVSLLYIFIILLCKMSCMFILCIALYDCMLVGSKTLKSLCCYFDITCHKFVIASIFRTSIFNNRISDGAQFFTFEYEVFFVFCFLYA
jgi:hypothetical protein